MGISYNKLWKLLVDLKMSKAELRKRANISSGTLTKLRKEQPVTLEILMKICDVCHCDIGDIVSYTNVENSEQE